MEYATCPNFQRLFKFKIRTDGGRFSRFCPTPCLYIVRETKGVKVQYLRGYVDKQSLPPIRMNSLKTNIYLYTFDGKPYPPKEGPSCFTPLLNPPKRSSSPADSSPVKTCHSGLLWAAAPSICRSSTGCTVSTLVPAMCGSTLKPKLTRIFPSTLRPRSPTG